MHVKDLRSRVQSAEEPLVSGALDFRVGVLCKTPVTPAGVLQNVREMREVRMEG